MEQQEISQELLAKGKRIISAIRCMKHVDKTDKVSWHDILYNNVPDITESDRDYLYENGLASELGIVRALLPDVRREQLSYIFAMYSYRDFLLTLAGSMIAASTSNSKIYNEVSRVEVAKNIARGVVPNLSNEEFETAEERHFIFL